MKILVPFKLWTIISIPVIERNGGLFPFLILGDNHLSASAAKFANALSNEGWSDQKIIKSLQAIGRFFTYYTAMNNINDFSKLNSYQLFGAYAELRFRGSLDVNNADKLELFWKRVNFSTVRKEVASLNLFSDFCYRYFNSNQVNPAEAEITKTFKSYRDLTLQGLSDALVHLDGIRRGQNKRNFELNIRRNTHKINIPKYLSTNSLIDLIEDGCKNPRDKMIVLLMGFGGLRISETLHIFTQDVCEIFESTNATKVILAHPSEGKIRISYNNEVKIMNRSEVLRVIYKRLPRNELGIDHLEFAGWKGMLLDMQSMDKNYIFWLEEHITGTYFRKLLEQYLSENKSLFCNTRIKHPYLFFNIQKNRKSNVYGNPLTYYNAQEIFSAASKRIGLEDFSPHSCRHHYGFYSANVLNVSPETLQRQLRHKQITSTQIYFHLSPDSVRNTLNQHFKNNNEKNISQKIIFPSHWNYS